MKKHVRKSQKDTLIKNTDQKRWLFAGGGALCMLGLYGLQKYGEKNGFLFQPGGYAISSVTSGSMEPVLHAGDLVVVHQEKQYHPGNIVIYRRKGDSHLIIHRIVQIQNGQVTARGDANAHADPSFAEDRIVGKMMARIPAAGRLLSFFRTPVGWSLLGIGLIFSLMPEKEMPVVKDNCPDHKGT